MSGVYRDFYKVELQDSSSQVVMLETEMSGEGLNSSSRTEYYKAARDIFAVQSSHEVGNASWYETGITGIKGNLGDISTNAICGKVFGVPGTSVLFLEKEAGRAMWRAQEKLSTGHH